MATVTISDLDEILYKRLRARAALNERSPEIEAREMLANELGSAAGDWVADLERGHEAMIAKYGVLPDSTPVIRQMRDEG